jgi:hypothetical protein
MSTTALYIRKELAVLPAVLTPNTIYAVRRGTGFDLYITDSAGTVAVKHNNTDDPLKSPVFTRVSGVLTQIEYADGAVKEFTRVGGAITQIDTIRGGVTTRKTFTRSGGALLSITEVTL